MKGIAIGIALAGIAVVGLACSDPVSHIFLGKKLDPARTCLDPATAVDVVDGPDPGTCARACVVTSANDDGGATYVSTTCAPYPKDFDTSGKSAACAVALAAFDRGDTCLLDGGSTHPIADAGRD